MDWKNKEDRRVYFRNYMQKYIKSSKGMAVRKKAKLKYRINGNEKKQRKTYRLNNPKIRKAHTFVERLLNKGFKKPINCMICFKKLPLIAHHPDYKFPNIFIWVCRKCHAKVHRKGV